MNIRKIIKEEVDDFSWAENIPRALPKIELYYERYMDGYEVFDDYQGLGPGTLVGGDSGYVDNHLDLVDRLRDDMGHQINDTSQIEFVNVESPFITTFIKGYEVTW